MSPSLHHCLRARLRDRRPCTSGRSSSSLPVPESVISAVDHDVAAMRELERMEGVLLDQEHGELFASRLSSRMASKICRTISGARPSEGSSSSSRRGRAISARAIASICCSPPESVPPRWCRRSLRRGNSVKTRSRSASKCVVAGDDRAHLQVFQHRHAREDAAALRRLRDAQPRDLVGRQARDVVPVEHDRALARARIAEDRHHQGRLAGAVGADQRDDLAVGDVDVDALRAR